MKVKCLKIINEFTQQDQEMSAWLTVNKEYNVLAMEVRTNKNFFLLIDDSINQAPHLHDAKQFEVVTHGVPSNWVINAGNLEVMTIGPKVWQNLNFWEECYEGNEAALELYKKEVTIILEEENSV